MITTGVVLARAGSAYRVHTDQGEVVATLRGKLKHRDDDRVVAGDVVELEVHAEGRATISDRKSTRLNSSHVRISYAVFCLKKKNSHIAHNHTVAHLTVAADGKLRA